MKKLNAWKAIGVIAVGLLLIPASAWAAGRAIVAGVKQDNDTGDPRTDFHMKICSDTNMDCDGAPNGGELRVDAGPVLPATISNNNTACVSFDWVVPIPEGSTVTAGVVCEQEEKNDFTVTAYFTPQSSPTDVPSVGWRILPNGHVKLTNAYSASAVIFSDLRLDTPVDLSLTTIMSLLAGSPSGSLAATSSGSVPSGSVASPGTQSVDALSLSVGDFVVGRMDTSFANTGFSALQGTVLLGHEHQAGENVPAISGLWKLGLLGMLGATAFYGLRVPARRRRNR